MPPKIKIVHVARNKTRRPYMGLYVKEELVATWKMSSMQGM
jgi:hypothetical protein